MSVTRRAQSLLPFLPYPYRGGDEVCNVCKSSDYTTVCEYDRRWKPLRTVVCNSCGLMRTNPMPTPDEIGTYYATEYRGEQLAGKAPPRFHIVRRTREAQARVAIVATALKSGIRVLDVGSGSGEFLVAARERGCEVLGIDPGESFSAFARKQHNLQVITAPWQKVDLPDSSFDLITLYHVLEHMREPFDTLRQMALWLKASGNLHITVPNMLPNGAPSFESFHFDHLHGFIPETLVRAAGACGLEVDPRFRSEGTDIVFRKSGVVQEIRPNAETAAKIVSMYPPASIAKFVFGGDWLRGIVQRTARDVRDSR